MVCDVTARVAEARRYYEDLLAERIQAIADLAGVSVDHFVKINPADFIEKNCGQVIHGYKYQKIHDWIKAQKTTDDTFLISPLDAIEETAAQISYKTDSDIRRTIRASKCDVAPVPVAFAQDFFIRNHRQSAPLIRETAICFGLLYRGELVAVMLYDISNGAVRGRKKDYELVRLAISKGTRIHGGASKLQAACEDTLRAMGIQRIYSYSNATINSGHVYERLGFSGSGIQRGQPFVILSDNSLTRLANLHPYSTVDYCIARGWFITHVGGNKKWVKDI